MLTNHNHRFLNVEAVVGSFNQEKVLLGAFSVIVQLHRLIVLKVVQEYEKVVIFRLGRILGGGERGPGIFFILPCTDKFEIVDMRVQNWSVPPQEMITR